MAEFAKEFSDQHMIQIAPIILPEMCRIVIEKDVYAVETRSRAVQIFRYLFLFSDYIFNIWGGAGVENLPSIRALLGFGRSGKKKISGKNLPTFFFFARNLYN